MLPLRAELLQRGDQQLHGVDAELGVFVDRPGRRVPREHEMVHPRDTQARIPQANGDTGTQDGDEPLAVPCRSPVTGERWMVVSGAEAFVITRSMVTRAG